MYRNTGIKVDFINLAGGIDIPFLPEDSPADIEEISYCIKKAYDETIVKAGLHPILLFTELGIYITGPYGYFVSSVLHVKKTYKNFIGLDALHRWISKDDSTCRNTRGLFCYLEILNANRKVLLHLEL